MSVVFFSSVKSKALASRPRPRLKIIYKVKLASAPNGNTTVGSLRLMFENASNC